MFETIVKLTSGQPYWLQHAVSALVAGIVAIALALVFHRIIFRVLRRIAGASDTGADDILVRRLARPTRYALVALALVLAAREMPFLEQVWQRVAGFVMPALIGWMALAVLNALIDAMALRADITVADNLQARRQRTRLAIFSRIGSFIIVFITVGLMLLSIPGVRDIGVTLVASAGLAGLAVGAAAQPALKSLIAGLQMAITEPIAIDDVVIVDGEWGRIEDIRTTYVVVKIWDERRLVVPTTKFLEDTFQNWTKTGSELLGTVMLYLDPAADVGPIRAEFERQIKAHRLWDGRVHVLQVTDNSPDAIEVRLLMSAADASSAFDLRCALREGMLDWIRRNQPEALVRRRTLPVAPVELAAGPSMAGAIAGGIDAKDKRSR